MVKVNTPKIHINKQKLVRVGEAAIVPTLFVGIAGASTAKDYKKAIPEHKKNVLIKNSIIIGSTAIGAAVAIKHTNKLLPKLDKLKVFGKKYEQFNEVVKEYFKNFSVPTASILSGVISGQLTEQALPVSTKDDKTKSIYNDFINNLDGGTIGKTFDYAGMGSGAAFDTTFSTLSGFKAGKVKGLANKVKKACYEIFAGVAVPVLIVVPFTKIVLNNTDNYIGKWVNGNKLKKSFFVVPVALGSCLAGNTIAKWFNDKVTNKLAKNELWQKIEQKQKELMAKTINAIQSGNHKQQQTKVKQIDALNQAKQQKA